MGRHFYLRLRSLHLCQLDASNMAGCSSVDRMHAIVQSSRRTSMLDSTAAFDFIAVEVIV